MSQSPEPMPSERAARRAARRARRRERRASRGLFVGLLLIAFGVAFLLQSLDLWTVRGDIVWPLILIVLGAWVLFSRVLGDRSSSDEA